MPETKVIHLHTSEIKKNNNLVLLMIPTIVYIFIIAFYLMTTGAIRELRQISARTEIIFTDENGNSKVLGEQKPYKVTRSWTLST